MAPHRLIARDLHRYPRLALQQQRIVGIKMTTPADIQNDPPTLAPIIIQGMHHHRLITHQGFGACAAQAAGQDVGSIFPALRLCVLGEYRAGELQGDSRDGQHRQHFDQAKAFLHHAVSFPGGRFHCCGG